MFDTFYEFFYYCFWEILFRSLIYGLILQVFKVRWIVVIEGKRLWEKIKRISVKVLSHVGKN